MVCLSLLAACSSGGEDSASPPPSSLAAKEVAVPSAVENRVVREAYDNALALFDKARTRAQFDRAGDVLLEI